MSTSSTVRRFGATKTYGRTREKNVAPAVDEITEKSVSVKASPASTKWGKTNFVAIRDEKRSPFQPPPGPEKKDAKPEDPFSFDTEDKRKVNTRSSQRNTVVVAEPSRSLTRLPASRIVTQGKKSAVNVEPKDFVGSQDSETAVARPGKTYSRAQEGRLNTSSAVPSSGALILDQFVEVGKTVRTDSGYEVVYSIEPHEPSTTSEVPVTIDKTQAALKEKEPPPPPPLQKKRAEPPSSQETLSSKDESSDLEDDDDDDIFPATFRRTPLKTYTGEIITPIHDIPDDPPPKKRKKGPSGLPRGRRPSRYTDPNLIEEYRRRYEETHGKKEPTAGMFNSTVVSSKELKGKQGGTTLVVVCKPKVEVSEKKDDVQTKYFKNVKKELDKSGKNLEAAGETVPKDNTKKVPSTPSEPVASSTPSPIIKKTPSSSSQDSSSASSTPSRLLKVRFADEETCSAANTLTALSTSLGRKQPPRSATTQNKQKPVSQASSEAVSQPSETSTNSTTDGSSDNKTSGIATRTRSGGKQYRIFKSRGPPQPAAKEPAKEDESASQENSEPKPDSPPMPELEREAPEAADMDGVGQNPPNITDDEEESHVSEETAEETPAESETLLTDSETPLTDSQVSEQSTEDFSEGSEEPVEGSAVSQGKTPDSQDTPSPAASDDSQELSQEVPSSADSQKEDSVPSVPRRFFKSKTPSSATSLQRKVFKKSPLKASYNVRSWQQEEGADKESDLGPTAAKQAKKVPPFTEEGAKAGAPTGRKAGKEPHLTRAVHWPKDRNQQAYTSVRVNKQHKDLYTVVHNVKMAYEVQESGETQDFMDDVEYLLDNLKDTQPMSIRALSTIQLAGKCISSAFRMHLRAHGTVTKIFSLLHDACSHPSLALSTASMMFMLSRDRLNMDLDEESLHLMLKLNEVDMPRSTGTNRKSKGNSNSGQNGESSVAERASGDPESAAAAGADTNGGEDSVELDKCRARIQEMLVMLQKETNAKQIDLDFVSTGNLAMESLLSLTSRRAGEWFKEELRALGGLDHFVETIHRCGSAMTEDLASNLDAYTPGLRKLDRCLRVLENITVSNTDNQDHIIAYSNGLLVTSTGRLLQQCVQCLPTMPLQEVENETELKEQAGWIVFECLLAILRVLLNVTHNSEKGSRRVGQEEGVLNTVLSCVAVTQWCVPPDQRFDLLVLSLGLLINLVEHCGPSRQYLVESRLLTQSAEHQEPTEMGALQTLVQLFLQRETAAREMEEAPENPSQSTQSSDTVNKSGEWHESDSGIQWIARSAEQVKAASEEGKKTGGNNDEREGGGSGGEKAAAEEKGDSEAVDKSTDAASSSILEDEETFTKALHKAGKHMENSIVASYVGLLLGCLIQENKDCVEAVRKYLPEGSFEPMIKILKKFLGFMSLTTAVGTTDANSIQRVIETLEAC